MSWTVLGRNTRALVAVGVVLAGALLVGVRAATSGPPSPAVAVAVGSSDLASGWALKSASGFADSGATISQVGYGTSGWNPVTLPSTVLGGLVANGVYANINFGTNLQSVPDLTTQSWWFRGEFAAPAA